MRGLSQSVLKLSSLFFIALILRLLFAIPVLRHPERCYVPGDSERYERLAVNILTSKRFSIDDEPYFLRPPVYPTFIAVLYWLFGFDVRFVVLAQVVISALTTFVVFSLTRKLFSDSATASFGALIFAINPLSIAMCAVMMSETLFVALTSLSLLFFVSAFNQPSRNYALAIAHSIACGILIGVATLCRSVAIGLAPVFLLLLFFVRRGSPLKMRFSQSLVLALAIFVTILPWLSRNRILLGEWLIDSNAHVSLVFFASKVLSERYNMTTSDADRLLLKLASQKFGWQTQIGSDVNLHIFCERHPKEALQLASLARQVIMSEVKQSLQRYLQGCILMWVPFISYSTWLGVLCGKVPEVKGAGDGVSATMLKLLLRLKLGEAFKLAFGERILRYPLVSFLWLMTVAIELLVYVLSLVGLFYTRDDALTFWLAILLLSYFSLTGGVVGHFNLSRLRMPLEPLLCLLASIGLKRFLSGEVICFGGGGKGEAKRC